MEKFLRAFNKPTRWPVFAALFVLALLSMGVFFGNNVSANHPVLVEGNCDSPVPGTTIVSPGTCGDYDGDGRIGTAEDTDATDRIFGTINGALGFGSGAAAGTGANQNGSVTIVRSGRYPEQVIIAPNNGHVTLQAAPGVSAEINAILQGDPAGGNVARTNESGITVVTPGSGLRVTLRNLTIRNFATGVILAGSARVTMDNCRLENNLNYGILLIDDARLAAKDVRIASTGFRTGVGSSVTALGHAISFQGNSAGTVYHSQITGSLGAAITNTSSVGAGNVRYYEVFLSHNGAGIVNATRDNSP